MGFSVESMPPLKDEKGIISSTRIRQAIAAGDVASAALDLGRYYFLAGPVVHGDGRGHTIEIPTANVHIPPGKLLPANGIYACWASVEGRRFMAAVNVGIRPMFTPDLPAPLVEAHLLDLNEELYGRELRLEFVEYLRPEKVFPSVKALVKQIQKDIGKTRLVLS
jgi:riboflavin kinase / FMN adenylyltransferase